MMQGSEEPDPSRKLDYHRARRDPQGDVPIKALPLARVQRSDGCALSCLALAAFVAYAGGVVFVSGQSPIQGFELGCPSLVVVGALMMASSFIMNRELNFWIGIACSAVLALVWLILFLTTDEPKMATALTVPLFIFLAAKVGHLYVVIWKPYRDR